MDAKRKEVVHPIAPLYDERSRVLILGTLPSPKSREALFYYAHPQNRFWPVLAAVLDAPPARTTDARRALALSRGVALWDVVARCDIEGAADHTIRGAVPNDFGEILRRADIQAVFATGQTAARLYRKLCQPAAGPAITALPSTSPANCAWSFDRLVGAYRVILPFLEG